MYSKSLLDISGVYHIKERLFQRLLKHHGMASMSPAQGRILMALWEQDDITIRYLATLTSLDKSTLSLALARMEEYGIVKRIGDLADRRIMRVRLTEHGKSYRHACAAILSDLSHILYRDVDPKDQVIFIKVLGQVFGNLSSEEQFQDL